MSIMGIDIGDKRIGIAITDRENKFSITYSIFPNNSYIRQNLEKVIKEKKIEKIVVGMPYTLRGEIGKQGKKVMDFINENLKDTGPDIIYFDERYTSKIHLRNAINKRKIKGRIDKFSAASILSDYLDTESGSNK